MSETEGVFAVRPEEVLRYLTRVVGHADSARDLTQEVFLRAARATAPAVPAEQRAWIFTIARNLGLNHIRDRGRTPVMAPLAEVATPPRQEHATALEQALNALDALDRDVFLLRENGGLTYDEIAAACGLSNAAVRSRLHRARVALRERLSAPLADHRRIGIRWSERQSHD